MDRKTAERLAKNKTVAQMKAELGLDRTVQGHTRYRRDQIIEFWIAMMTGV